MIVSLSQAVALPLILSWVSPVVWPLPASAHQVELEGDVGATLHIEPNDTPRAGEEVLAWFALVRKGGQTIPLADCNCQLAIYEQSAYDQAAKQEDEGASPTLAPPLSAVAAEDYQGIPGATFTFPDVGAYTLVMSGSPQQAGSFNDFEFDFDVTVAAGQAIPKIPEDEAAALPQPQDGDDNVTEPVVENVRSPLPNWLVPGIGGVLLIGAIAWVAKRRSGS
ncbi:MAG: hypothetical protein AAGC93_07870 [Cyanobacteria bacterium P01_F01_bin.53]